ncbi:alkene reductase [Corynebacterium urogenitale]
MTSGTTLYDPVRVGQHDLTNRLTMAALTRQRAGEDGTPTDLHVQYYAQRASAGLVVTEGAFPTFESRTFPGQAGIANADHVDAWRRVADEVHANNGVLFIQVMQGGRIGHPANLRGAEPIAPSAIASGTEFYTYDGKLPGPVPREATAEDLRRVVSEFVAAARRAVDAGIDGVEVHGANGYLLHQFLSPASNKRTDEYGGSAAHRARFVVEIVRAVAEEIGAERTALRISPEHNIQGALEEDRADVLETYGALLDGVADLDLAYLSLLHKDALGVEDSHDADATSDLPVWIRERFHGPLIVNSGFAEITEREEAEQLVASGRADAVAVGRMFIANPDLARRWEENLGVNEPDPSTFYKGGERGYTDYPFVDEA